MAWPQAALATARPSGSWRRARASALSPLDPSNCRVTAARLGRSLASNGTQASTSVGLRGGSCTRFRWCVSCDFVRVWRLESRLSHSEDGKRGAPESASAVNPDSRCRPQQVRDVSGPGRVDDSSAARLACDQIHGKQDERAHRWGSVLEWASPGSFCASRLSPSGSGSGPSRRASGWRCDRQLALAETSRSRIGEATTPAV